MRGRRIGPESTVQFDEYTSHFFASICPCHSQSNYREQSCKFGRAGDVSVFDIEASGFGIGEETLDPPSPAIEDEWIFGRWEICFDQRQLATSDLSPFETQ